MYKVYHSLTIMFASNLT
uniref:Uncharacterized protein n=1 Tax=Rhizophora mucronata TaxID=61149 RepID=A0A2P2Q3S1_RHIMU